MLPVFSAFSLRITLMLIEDGWNPILDKQNPVADGWNSIANQWIPVVDLWNPVKVQQNPVADQCIRHANRFTLRACKLIFLQHRCLMRLARMKCFGRSMQLHRGRTTRSGPG